MKENIFLNKTLELLESKGVNEAYEFMLDKKYEVKSWSAQVYNYLYCLAALCGRKEEAMSWLNEVIMIKGYWYRPEVFEDEDLDSLRDDNRFRELRDISDKRYLRAVEEAETFCTWKEIKGRDLALALHGNQQNIDISIESWNFLKKYGYQVEYVQSASVDSYELFRWEDKGKNQLADVLDKISWNEYETRTLGGFSAGCNEILKTFMVKDFKCERIILQSPWIPVIDNESDKIMNCLKERDTEVIVICGDNDKDCIRRANIFVDKAKVKGLNISEYWVKDLGHDFPDDFEEYLLEFMVRK